ncbi:hypothetical protein cypCar_00047011, partial [Cyprinus carpio]
FYCGESYWASDDKDVQLELEITDAIYNLLGSSASQEIDVQLEVVTDNHVSVGYCSPGEMHVQLEVDENEDISVCEVKDLQLEMNRNGSVSELKSPALVSEDLSDPAGPSVKEANYQENSPTEESCVPSAPEPEPEVNLVDIKQSCVTDPSVPEPEPEVDLLDPEESCVPDPSD